MPRFYGGSSAGRLKMQVPTRTETLPVAARRSAVLAAALALGCESAEVKQCLKQYEEAQAIVYKVDAGASDSVAKSLKAVEATLELCKKAERHKEVAELTNAKNQLAAQLAAIERKAARR